MLHAIRFGRRAFWYAIALAGGAGAVVAIALAGTPSSKDVVATVAGVSLTASDVQTLLLTLDPAKRQAATSSLDNLTALVRRKAEEIAVLKDAERRNWQSDPTVVAQIKEAQDAVITTTYLASIGKPPKGYPSEDEIRAAFDKMKERGLKPPQYRLQQLLIERPSDSGGKEATTLTTFVAELEHRARTKGSDFQKLAENSKGPARVAYTDLGFAPDDKIAAELRPLLAKANIGDILPVVSLPEGYALLKLHDFKPAVPYGFAELHDEIAAALLRQKTSETQRVAVKAILGKTPVTIDAAALGVLIGK